MCLHLVCVIVSIVCVFALYSLCVCVVFMVYSLRALALPYFSPRPFRIFCFLTTFTARQPFPSSPDCHWKNIQICEILLSLRELTTAMIETPSTDFCALFYCIFVLQFFHIFIGLAAVVVNKLWRICSNWFPHTESTQSSHVTLSLQISMIWL